MADPLPMLTLFDKQIQLRMGHANVKKWVDDITPLLINDHPLGVDSFATHTLPHPTPATSFRRSRTAPSRSFSSHNATHVHPSAATRWQLRCEWIWHTKDKDAYGELHAVSADARSRASIPRDALRHDAAGPRGHG